MDYYCDLYDKTIKNKNKTENLPCLTHNELDKCIRLKHNIENLDFFDLYEFF